MRRISAAVHRALPACLHAAGPGSPITSLESVSLSIISDREMSRVHAQFFGDPSPTDVVTFDYGEILIGAAEAARNAEFFACGDASREIALCSIHGMLHLGGWRDGTKREARAMHALQDRILRESWAPAGLAAGVGDGL